MVDTKLSPIYELFSTDYINVAIHYTLSNKNLFCGYNLCKFNELSGMKSYYVGFNYDFVFFNYSFKFYNGVVDNLVKPISLEFYFNLEEDDYVKFFVDRKKFDEYLSGIFVDFNGIQTTYYGELFDRFKNYYTKSYTVDSVDPNVILDNFLLHLENHLNSPKSFLGHNLRNIYYNEIVGNSNNVINFSDYFKK